MNGTVDIWATRWADLAANAERLSADERTRLAVMRLAVRERFVQARAFLHDVLRTYGRGEVRLAERAGGKLWWPGSGIGFNTSHDGAWVVVAVRSGGEVGVDVEEQVGAGRRGAVERYLTRRERTLAAVLTEEDRGWYLAACWVIREASVKARGAGLASAEGEAMLWSPPTELAWPMRWGEVWTSRRWSGWVQQLGGSVVAVAAEATRGLIVRRRGPACGQGDHDSINVPAPAHDTMLATGHDTNIRCRV